MEGGQLPGPEAGGRERDTNERTKQRKKEKEEALLMAGGRRGPVSPPQDLLTKRSG